MRKKIGVLLSGCGVFDGSEIQETVLTLLALDRAGAEIICMAPNIDQTQVINHKTQEPTEETRNVLVESARIARGDIKDLANVSADDLDALILPGGFGAAKNLSDFAVNGADATVHPDVTRILTDMLSSKKPIGSICISPVILAKSLSENRPELTIGIDPDTAMAIEAMGGRHVNCAVNAIHVDQKNNIVSTPAYMLGPGVKDVAVGIEKLVNQVLALIDNAE